MQFSHLIVYDFIMCNVKIWTTFLELDILWKNALKNIGLLLTMYLFNSGKTSL